MLLERIPAVPDLQATWLILFFCAPARANFLLRALPPEATREFAKEHDESLWMSVCHSPWVVWALCQRTWRSSCGFLGMGCLEDHIPGVHVQSAAPVWQVSIDVGFEASQWAELAMGHRPPGWVDNEDPTTPKHGWQFWATQPVNAQFMEATVRPRLNKLLETFSANSWQGPEKMEAITPPFAMSTKQDVSASLRFCTLMGTCNLIPGTQC